MRWQTKWFVIGFLGFYFALVGMLMYIDASVEYTLVEDFENGKGLWLSEGGNMEVMDVPEGTELGTTISVETGEKVWVFVFMTVVFVFMIGTVVVLD